VTERVEPWRAFPGCSGEIHSTTETLGSLRLAPPGVGSDQARCGIMPAAAAAVTVRPEPVVTVWLARTASTQLIPRWRMPRRAADIAGPASGWEPGVCAPLPRAYPNHQSRTAHMIAARQNNANRLHGRVPYDRMLPLLFWDGLARLIILRNARLYVSPETGRAFQEGTQRDGHKPGYR
jgi:hypothetical protein